MLLPYIVFLHTYSASSSIKDESGLFPLSSLNCGGQIVLLSQAVAAKIAAEPAVSERGRTTQCGFRAKNEAWAWPGGNKLENT